MFQSGNEGHISLPSHTLETQHFLSIWYAPRSTAHSHVLINMWAQIQFRNWNIRGNSPDYTNHSRNNLSIFLKMYFFQFVLKGLGWSVFYPVQIHAILIPRYRNFYQNIFMLAPAHKCDVRAIVLQALLSQEVRITHKLCMLILGGWWRRISSPLLETTFQYSSDSILRVILFLVSSVILLYQLSAANNNVLDTPVDFLHRQQRGKWTVLVITYLINLHHPFGFLLEEPVL